MKRSFIVTLDVPEGVGISDMNKHIRDAVSSWANGGSPDSPLYMAWKGKRVTVRRWDGGQSAVYESPESV